jgi:hypothetical protein
MTRFIYDEFSKDYLDELLSAYGEVKPARIINPERQEIDVYFQPHSPPLTAPLGLLGKMVNQLCIFEPYRNPVTPQQIRACLAKLLAVEAEIIREFKRQKKQIKEEDLPKLWILTPTASEEILQGFQAKIQQQWGNGIYFTGELIRTALVVIHQLPVTSETLLLRLLGRGKVQSRAIEEIESLSDENPFKSVILEQLYNLQQNLSIQTEVETEDRELIMRLAPLYQQDRAKAIQEGKQEGLREGKQEGLQEGEANLLIRLLNRRFQGISTELEARIRALPIESLEMLGEALFDFQSEEDLSNWLP